MFFGTSVLVGAGVKVEVRVSVGAGVNVGVSVGVNVGVSVGVSVGVNVGVSVGVLVGVSVAVDVGVSVGPINCPGPQPEIHKLAAKQTVAVICHWLFMSLLSFYGRTRRLMQLAGGAWVGPPVSTQNASMGQFVG